MKVIRMSAPIQSYLSQYKIPDTNVYAVPMEMFKTLDIRQWKYNRPPDMSRVPEIRKWMKEFHRMDGVLNLAYIQNEGLVCFEGNHRRLALEGLDIKVLLDIVWYATDEIVKCEFQRLNKSVSVPDLYVVETDATLRVQIEEAVATFRKKYPAHESSSGRPIRPNFNRDKLTDEFTRLQKELRISVPDLVERLYILNEKYKMKNRSKLSPNVQLKCGMSDLWLFAWSTTIATSELEDL
jgi:hypothetical protein